MNMNEMDATRLVFNEQSAIKYFEDRIDEVERASASAVSEMKRYLQNFRESMWKKDFTSTPATIASWAANQIPYIATNIRTDLLFKAAELGNFVREYREKNDLLQ